MMKLYAGQSPNSLKVMLALEELGLAYEPMWLDLKEGKQRSEAYLAINPNAKIPTLVDDDVPIWESGAILIWLGLKHGKVLSEDPTERAHAIQFVLFEAANVAPTIGGSGLFGQLYRPEELQNAQQIEELRAELTRLVGVIERVFSDGREYFAGSFSIADLALLPGLKKCVEAGLVDSPTLANWVDRVAQRPAVRAVFQRVADR